MIQKIKQFLGLGKTGEQPVNTEEVKNLKEEVVDEEKENG